MQHHDHAAGDARALKIVSSFRVHAVAGEEQLAFGAASRKWRAGSKIHQWNDITAEPKRRIGLTVADREARRRSKRLANEWYALVVEAVACRLDAQLHQALNEKTRSTHRTRSSGLASLKGVRGECKEVAPEIVVRYRQTQGSTSGT
jgi:hypothetical protein